MSYILTFLFAYLLGCSNMALYLSRLKKVDLRSGGSKNLEPCTVRCDLFSLYQEEILLQILLRITF